MQSCIFGITPHEPIRTEEDKNEKENKNEENMEKGRKKGVRRVEDGLLLVVPKKFMENQYVY